MHIVKAFEQVVDNRDEINRKITNLMMDAAKSGNMELAEQLKEISGSVSEILKPFTD
jgi:hypothetical protein